MVLILSFFQQSWLELAVQDPGRESTRGSRSQDLGRLFFFSLFHLFHVSLDGLSERGTTVFNRISAALK